MSERTSGKWRRIVERWSSRQSVDFSDPSFRENCLKVQKSILLLMLKKHLKSLYQISSTAIALASLKSDNPGVNKRDNAINGVEPQSISIPPTLSRSPNSIKDLVSLLKSFQMMTFADPVEKTVDRESEKLT